MEAWSATLQHHVGVKVAYHINARACQHTFLTSRAIARTIWKHEGARHGRAGVFQDVIHSFGVRTLGAKLVDPKTGAKGERCQHVTGRDDM